MARYLVFDEETTIKQSHKRKANCFDEDNWIVARGWKLQGDPRNSWTYHPVKNRFTQLKIPEDVNLLVGFNIKFDLMWEMAQGCTDLVKFFKRGGKIWDCQYAEYLIEGHIDSVQMVSLDDIIESYGGRKKIDEVKIMWEQGINTDEIPEDLLIDYLVGTEEEDRNSGDIGNTELIFLGQIKKAAAQRQIKMIQDRMDGLLSTTAMEFAGLKIDVAEAKQRLAKLTVDLQTATEKLDEYIKHLPWEFNWGSRTQVSCLIFGGTVKYQVREGYIDEATGEPARLKAKALHYVLADGRTTPIDPSSSNGAIVDAKIGYVRFLSGKRMGEYKTKQVEVPGELKIKWQDRFLKLPGYTDPDPSWLNKDTDGIGGPTYSTSSDVMDELYVRDIPFLKDLGRKNFLDKEIGTYYVRVDPKKGPVGMLTCVQPHDHMLHHKINHTSTITSRLSSNDPNLQNLPTTAIDEFGNQKSEVKKMFISRFTEAYCKAYGLPYTVDADGNFLHPGVMIEADYSQLEVVVQGVLSGDENLCQDLRDKIDFHCKRVSSKFGCTYEEALFWCKNEDYEDHALWKKRRTGVKEFSFQRAYGAGAAAISYKTGMPIDDIKALIAGEELMYPGITLFNANVETEVKRSAQPFQSANDNGEWQTYRRGDWWGPTRTRYRFRSHDAPAFLQKKGILDSFSPPELKNYPVQGTGGEFVQAVLGLLWRRFVETDFYGGRAYLVNTVHDCVWVDCHRDVLDMVASDLKRIMESIPEFYNTRHGMNITVPFPVEVECGPNMANLKHWHAGEPAWHHKQAA